MANTIKIKRGLKTDLPTLQLGEFGFTTDSKELFIGDGTGNTLLGSVNIIQSGDNVSELNNDANYTSNGDNISLFVNDSGYITNAAISNMVEVGDNVSALVNDANYTSSGDDISLFVNDAGYFDSNSTIDGGTFI